jgi:hypothetical protein
MPQNGSVILRHPEAASRHKFLAPEFAAIRPKSHFELRLAVGRFDCDLAAVNNTETNEKMRQDFISRLLDLRILFVVTATKPYLSYSVSLSVVGLL